MMITAVVRRAEINITGEIVAGVFLIMTADEESFPFTGMLKNAHKDDAGWRLVSGIIFPSTPSIKCKMVFYSW